MLHLSVILNCQYPELKLSCSKQNKGGAMFARNVNVILICTSASRGSIFEFNYFDSSVIYASKKCQEKGWVLELRTRSEHQDWMDVLPFWIQTHFHMSYVIYNVQLSRWTMWWQARLFEFIWNVKGSSGNESKSHHFNIKHWLFNFVMSCIIFSPVQMIRWRRTKHAAADSKLQVVLQCCSRVLHTCSVSS